MHVHLGWVNKGRLRLAKSTEAFQERAREGCSFRTQVTILVMKVRKYTERGPISPSGHVAVTYKLETCTKVPVCALNQPCPTCCDPMDWNLPGSSVREILQATILKGVATPSSLFLTQGSNPSLLHWQVGSSLPHWRVDSLPSELWGKPHACRLLKLKVGSRESAWT